MVGGGRGYSVPVLLVAIVEGELVLVEQVGELLVDRATGRVLDPVDVLLVGLEVDTALEPAA